MFISCTMLVYYFSQHLYILRILFILTVLAPMTPSSLAAAKSRLSCILAVLNDRHCRLNLISLFSLQFLVTIDYQLCVNVEHILLALRAAFEYKDDWIKSWPAALVNCSERNRAMPQEQTANLRRRRRLSSRHCSTEVTTELENSASPSWVVRTRVEVRWASTSKPSSPEVSRKKANSGKVRKFYNDRNNCIDRLRSI